MPRGIDHVIHAVHDLDAAAALYARLGFQVGARNRHAPAWGTQNHVVQFAGCFVELLAMADTSQIAPHAPRYFSFGAHNRDFLARREGLSMLVLEGRGERDAEAFRAAGIGDFQRFDFERDAKRPDGSSTKVGFSLAFASDPLAPDVGFFTSLQHYPENFWNPAFQDHPNTAASVAGVVLVAENPADHQTFLSAFTGQRETLATSAGLLITTPRSQIQMMTPSAFGDHFGTAAPDTGQRTRLAALRFAMRDFDQAASVLTAARFGSRTPIGHIAIGPDVAMGATLVFEPA